MIQQKTMIEWLRKLLLKKIVISISGSAGTGKTTLAQYLIGHFLTINRPFKGSAIWIQNSELFSKKRFKKIFESDPDKLYYLNRNIFITPSDKTCSSYFKQSEILKNIFKNESILPTNLKYIIIDNISHHLRYEISKYSDIKNIVSTLNDFFNSQLLPLIMFCQRENIHILLIHELSYNPKLDKNKEFFHKLYDRIDSLDIILIRNFITQRNAMIIKVDELNWVFKYQLVDKGLKWKNVFKE